MRDPSQLLKDWRDEGVGALEAVERIEGQLRKQIPAKKKLDHLTLMGSVSKLCPHPFKDLFQLKLASNFSHVYGTMTDKAKRQELWELRSSWDGLFDAKVLGEIDDRLRREHGVVANPLSSNNRKRTITEEENSAGKKARLGFEEEMNFDDIKKEVGTSNVVDFTKTNLSRNVKTKSQSDARICQNNLKLNKSENKAIQMSSKAEGHVGKENETNHISNRKSKSTPHNDPKFTPKKPSKHDLKNHSQSSNDPKLNLESKTRNDVDLKHLLQKLGEIVLQKAGEKSFEQLIERLSSRLELATLLTQSDVINVMPLKLREEVDLFFGSERIRSLLKSKHSKKEDKVARSIFPQYIDKKLFPELYWPSQHQLYGPKKLNGVEALPFPPSFVSFLINDVGCDEEEVRIYVYRRGNRLRKQMWERIGLAEEEEKELVEMFNATASKDTKPNRLQTSELHQKIKVGSIKSEHQDAFMQEVLDTKVVLKEEASEVAVKVERNEATDKPMVKIEPELEEEEISHPNLLPHNVEGTVQKKVQGFSTSQDTSLKHAKEMFPVDTNPVSLGKTLNGNVVKKVKTAGKEDNTQQHVRDASPVSSSDFESESDFDSTLSSLDSPKKSLCKQNERIAWTSFSSNKNCSGGRPKDLRQKISNRKKKSSYRPRGYVRRLGDRSRDEQFMKESLEDRRPWEKYLTSQDNLLKMAYREKSKAKRPPPYHERRASSGSLPVEKQKYRRFSEDLRNRSRNREKSSDDLGPSSSKSKIPWTVPQLCKFYLKDNCSKKERCSYMHQEFPCRHFHTGKVCPALPCRFSHEPLTEEISVILLTHLNFAPRNLLGDFSRMSSSKVAERLRRRGDDSICNERENHLETNTDEEQQIATDRKKDFAMKCKCEKVCICVM